MITETSKKLVDFKKVDKETVFSETQFYTVKSISGDKISLVNDNGESITVNSKYVENCMVASDQYTEEKTLNKTEATQLFLANPYTAMTANFNKQVKADEVVKEIQEAYESSTPKEFSDKMKKAVKKGLQGEERTIIGRHNGTQDEFGRVRFTDMKIEKDETKDYDTRQRLVDPRTLNWFVLKGVKYKVK